MDIGDRKRFAVSLELDSPSGGAWMFGKLCYWIKGEMVGSYDEGTSLRDVIPSMKWIVHDAGKRSNCMRFAMRPEDAFQSIDRTLYGDHDNVGHDVDNDPTARFDILPNIDIFDGWKMYLIDCNDQARLLYRHLSAPTVSECMLAQGEFDACVRLAWNHINMWYDSTQELG